MKDESVFNRGFLLALAERRRSFVSDGYRFDKAYGAALRAWPRQDDRVVRNAIADYDPVFGTHRVAQNMILEGLRDLIITLDGLTFRTANVCISQKAATRELNKLPDATAFRAMAAAFDLSYENTEEGE